MSSEHTAENRPDAPVLLEPFLPGSLLLTLNRPKRCNAFSFEMLRQLKAFFKELPNRPNCRVLVIAGRGSCFCSGLDLAEAYAGGFANQNAPAFLMPEMVQQIITAILTVPQTVVIAAGGPAFGGGGGLVAAADFVIASDKFKIGFPELFRGLKPSLLHPFLSRKLSPSAIKRLHFAPGGISAEEALRMELVQKIVPAEKLQEETIKRVRTLLAAEPYTLARSKKMINVRLIPPEVEIRTGLFDHWGSWRTEAAQEGVAAFLEKRAPRWPKLQAKLDSKSAENGDKKKI